MGQIVSAPAKVILLGEHAVVYGKPSLAAPFSSLRAYAEISPALHHAGLKIAAVDLGHLEIHIQTRDNEQDHPLAVAVHRLLEELQMPAPNVDIVLHADIPQASGMGSGAAITTALFRALLLALNRSLPDSRLNDLVFEIEKIHHGTPSGVDNTVIVYEQPIYFVRTQPIIRLQIARPVTLLIADTGISASTKVAVSDVRLLYQTHEAMTQQILDKIGDLVVSGRRAIETGDMVELGKVMNTNHELLRQLTVSSPQLDRLVETAQTSGALGAKLTGGGRGGNMIALVTEDTAQHVTERLMQVGAAKVYQTVVR